MSVKRLRRAVQPETLRDAHDFVREARPAKDAPLSEWLKFHRWSAAVYREVSEIDRGHHHEAMYWVGHEENHAAEVKARMEKEARAKRS